MSNIYPSLDQLIGRTPLLEATHIEENLQLKARLLVKLEYLNPAGSAKDRVAKAMIDEAEADGRLKPGSVIIEPTSGNTGIGLASLAAVLLHLWKGNDLLSIFGATILYMVLVQGVFS